MRWIPGLASRFAVLAALVACCILAARASNLLNPIIPEPQSAQYGSQYMRISAQSFAVQTQSASRLLARAMKRCVSSIFRFGPGSLNSSSQIVISVVVKDGSEDLSLGVDESYVMDVNTVGGSWKGVLSAPTVFGALRGLESLIQLTSYDDIANAYTLNGLPFTIKDAPRFPWRGILIDSARHFLQLDEIKRTIDAAAMSKFNTLHWHLVDAQSFPVQSKKYPFLAEKGAYRFPTASYSSQEMSEIVSYGKDRGVRVVAEIDVPGHTASWGKGDSSLVSACPSTLSANVNNVPLDVTQQHTLDVVKGLIQELTEIFPDQFFHTGGDEVVGRCWTWNQTIVDWMHKKNIQTSEELQTWFEKQIESFGADAWNRTIIFWQDVFDNAGKTRFDPNRVVFHVWQDPQTVKSVTAAGYKAITSAGWYLDKANPVGQNTHYHFWDNWQDMYALDPATGLTQAQARLVLGGEAALWGEYVDSDTIQVQLWPRAAAISERLWSSATTTSVTDAQRRMFNFSCYLKQRGINSIPLGPGFCPVPRA